MAFSGVIDLKERNCMLCQKCKIKKLLFLDFVLQKKEMFFLFQYCIENCKKDIKWFCNKLRRVGHLCYWIKTTIQTSNFFMPKNANPKYLFNYLLMKNILSWNLHVCITYAKGNPRSVKEKKVYGTLSLSWWHFWIYCKPLLYMDFLLIVHCPYLLKLNLASMFPHSL